MTPSVPLPPPPLPFETCAQAYDWWGQGRIRWDSLINGEIWLANGLRCPISESPHQAPVEVTIPPGQPPYVPPELAETGAWVWPAIGVGCALLVVGILLLIWLERRPKEATVGGRHHWVGEADLEPNGTDDEALVAEVTGLGEEREPGWDAVEQAAEVPTDWPDHRGERDRNPDAPHPWRPS